MSRSDFPSFDEFLLEMGEERINGWRREAELVVQRGMGFGFNLADPDDASRFVTAMFALNQNATFLMLRDYHAWLIDKLDSASLHLI